MTLNDFQVTALFVLREGDRYVWEGPRVDSRVSSMSVDVSWFWGDPPR